MLRFEWFPWFPLLSRLLADEPRLLLVGADHLAHQEVVGAVVALLSGASRRRANGIEHALVRVDEVRKLPRRLLALARRTRDHRFIRYFGRHRDGGSAQGLDAL